MYIEHGQLQKSDPLGDASPHLLTQHTNGSVDAFQHIQLAKWHIRTII